MANRRSHGGSTQRRGRGRWRHEQERRADLLILPPPIWCRAPIVHPSLLRWTPLSTAATHFVAPSCSTMSVCSRCPAAAWRRSSANGKGPYFFPARAYHHLPSPPVVAGAVMIRPHPGQESCPLTGGLSGGSNALQDGHDTGEAAMAKVLGVKVWSR